MIKISTKIPGFGRGFFLFFALAKVPFFKEKLRVASVKRFVMT
jgi:hypothetical protein